MYKNETRYKPGHFLPFQEHVPPFVYTHALNGKCVMAPFALHIVSVMKTFLMKNTDICLTGINCYE